MSAICENKAGVLTTSGANGFAPFHGGPDVARVALSKSNELVFCAVHSLAWPHVSLLQSLKRNNRHGGAPQ